MNERTMTGVTKIVSKKELKKREEIFALLALLIFNYGLLNGNLHLPY